MTAGPSPTGGGAALRVVVHGSGSAGRRHALALRDALPAARITVVRRPASTTAVQVLAGRGIDLADSLDAAVAGGVDLGVAAGPAPGHEHSATMLHEAGATVLVEKPLTDRVEAATRLVRLVQDGDPELVVGYHLRVGGVLPTLRRAVRDGTVGPVDRFDLRVGQHLSQWRPGTDPSASVTARAELGGGVLLELSHELDALQVLLGEVTEVAARLRHDGAPTDGRVETVADLELRTAGGATGTVHLDMVADPPSRTWRLSGPEGDLVADLLDGSIVHRRPDGTTRSVQAPLPAGERDRAEAALVANVISVRAGTVRPACTAAEGAAVVRLVDAARTSATTGTPVRPTGAPAGAT